MQNKRIARLARDAFLKEPLFKGFTDLRKNPSIRLQTILMSLFLMPFFGIASLLSNDREARTERYKRLFGCRRKMVGSDSTCARVLKWLKPQESQGFLLSFLQEFESQDLLRKSLSPKGTPRRLGILDGVLHGGPLAGDAVPAWGDRLPADGTPLREPRGGTGGGAADDACLREDPRRSCGRDCGCWTRCTSTPTRSRSPAARKRTFCSSSKKQTFGRSPRTPRTSSNTSAAMRSRPAGITQRQCRWKVRKTLDAFAGYPVQVVELKEYYPKRKRERNASCWIVSTDLDLTLEEVREAAHQRWQIENNVFKRISHLSGTKRFYFKDPRQFFNLLHLFFAAVAVLDYILALLRAHKRLFEALRAGIKDTWRNVFSRIREMLYDLPYALSRIA